MSTCMGPLWWTKAASCSSPAWRGTLVLLEKRELRRAGHTHVMRDRASIVAIDIGSRSGRDRCEIGARLHPGSSLDVSKWHGGGCMSGQWLRLKG